MIVIKLATAFLGLTVPGYLLARFLRLEHAWVVAFPFSALLMTLGVIGFSLVAIPIQLGTMAGLLLSCSVACWIFAGRRPDAGAVDAPSACRPPIPEALLVTLALLVAGAALLSLGYNATVYPLRGLDTYFRWDGLAREMLFHHALDFYPPVSSRDFSIYLFPEGIPPLVATVYWWVYASVGRPLAQATALSVVLQFSSALGLIFITARRLFGPRASWFTLLAASSTPLLVNGFAIGQETGFTTLSIVGQLCFALAAVRNPQLSTVVAAALFAALGALSREYGPALPLAGFAVLAWHRAPRRFVTIFIVVTAALSVPWFARTWILTGNPFYSHALPGGFRVNTVYAAMLHYYGDTFSLFALSVSDWLGVLSLLVTGGFLALVAGVPVVLRNFRTLPSLWTTIGLIGALWLSSVPKTAGGIAYSARVLMPAFAVLAVAAGDGLSRFFLPGRWMSSAFRGLALGGLAICLTYGLASVVAYPFARWPLSPAVSSSSAQSIQEVLLKNLEGSGIPATGVLTDDPHLAEMMKRHTRFRPVVYWNPEVEFLFDPTLDKQEMHRRLVEKKINLMVVDFASVNNPFLREHDHFNDSSSWEEALLIPGEAAVYSLSPR